MYSDVWNLKQSTDTIKVILIINSLKIDKNSILYTFVVLLQSV